MGTTLHAIVERHIPETPGTAPAHWDTVSLWEFNKDYSVMAELAKVKGFTSWPVDIGYHAAERARVVDDCQIFRLEELPLTFEFTPDASTYRSLIAALLAMVGEHVRVLFYRG